MKQRQEEDAFPIVSFVLVIIASIFLFASALLS